MIDRRRVPPVLLVLVCVVLPAAASAGRREEIVRKFEKTVALKPGQGLSIDHKSGDVQVRTHKAAEARISARIRGSSSDEEEIRKFVDAVAIEVESGSSRVLCATGSGACRP